MSPYVPKDEGAVILDFGCGYGFIMQEMQAINPKAKLIGLDVSDVALAKASASLPGVKFCNIASDLEIPLMDSSADFVISSEAIEHVYDVDYALSEIFRVLKVGGRLLLTTPYHGFMKNLPIVFFNFNNHFNPTGVHIRFFQRNRFFCA